MASNNITTNTPTSFMLVRETPTHIALAGTFDGCSVAVELDINGTTYPLLDGAGVPIVYTAAVNDPLSLNVGDKIRFSPTGAGVSTNIDWNVAGASFVR